MCIRDRPGLVERLSADPPARVADVGCGTGWSAISIARGFPKASVTGLDLDPASVEEARRNLVRQDPQAAFAISQFDEAVRLTQLAAANGRLTAEEPK